MTTGKWQVPFWTIGDGGGIIKFLLQGMEGGDPLESFNIANFAGLGAIPRKRKPGGEFQAALNLLADSYGKVVQSAETFPGPFTPPVRREEAVESST